MSDLLNKWIDEAKNIIIFTGAGISTESGIPDFRSPGGLWSRMKPIMFQDFLSSEKTRIESWSRKFDSENDISFAKPNEGHKAIAKLINTGKASYVITQNIDNLHQDSEIPEDKIIELHGNSSYAICLECKQRYKLKSIKLEFESKPIGSRVSPTCKKCGGIIKSATISFGMITSVFWNVLILVLLQVIFSTYPVLPSTVIQSLIEKGLSIFTKIPLIMSDKLA